jgi:hypothetical protein
MLQEKIFCSAPAEFGANYLGYAAFHGPLEKLTYSLQNHSMQNVLALNLDL